MKKQIDMIDILSKAGVETRLDIEETQKDYKEELQRLAKDHCDKIDAVNKRLDKHEERTYDHIDKIVDEQQRLRNEFHKTVMDYMFDRGKGGEGYNNRFNNRDKR